MTKPKITEKRWSKELEEPIYEDWKSKKIYKFNKNTKKQVYSIDTPPPYVNTPVHIGQVTTYVLMDMFARFRRMSGYEVLFPLGLDRNGLPIEMAAEKEFKVKLTALPRKKAIELCKKILEKSSLASVESFLRCGIGFNSLNKGNDLGEIYETDSPEYRAITQGTFIDMWKKKLIYEDERINNYCPGCQTTIADAEIEYREIPTLFNDIIFKCKETGEDLIIGTTRPELVPTCGMVIYNPDDERYKHLKGKTAISPIFNKEIPIQPHPLAEIDKGTGLVMMCSAGDLSDIRFFREMNLTPMIAIHKDGTMNKHAGFLEGLPVKQAREKIISELKEKNLLVKQKETMHRTPICERSKDEIEFISMKEFYVKQVELKSKMKQISDKLNFFDKTSKQILLDWIDSVSIDWPISRRRFYATEVPLWYCKKCKELILPPKGKYYQPWKENPPIKKCKCGSTEFIGETRVFDTWFDSSITPLYILGYERNPEFFKKHFPCSLRPQGKEIVRTWLYYTLLKDYLLTNKIIFKDVWINYHIVDEKGHKMSKSKGNIIDPKEVLDKYGAEPFRLWSAVEGNLTKTDFRCSFERIDSETKTLVKLWNVVRFISIFKKEKPTKLEELDKWIIQELNELIEFTRTSYQNYDFHNPVIKLRHFIWETFASHYVELVKSRAYRNDKSALYTLHYCIDNLLKLLAPVIPFITYKLFKDLRGKDIHFEKFPEVDKTYKTKFSTKELEELNSKLWKAKKDRDLSLKSEIHELTLNPKFNLIKNDLKDAHHIINLNFGNKFKVLF